LEKALGVVTVPGIVDYPQVLQRLAAEGLRCNYPNGGSFRFDCETLIRGWIGPADATIKPAMQESVRNFPQPYAQNLASAAARAWRQYLPGAAWLMPAAHWAYELAESGQWLAEALQDLHLPAGRLRQTSQAAAIEFCEAEAPEFSSLLHSLLENLAQSDFALAFPGRPIVCSIHHHKQLWWVTPESRLMAALDKAQRDLNY
jgi:hypothetical protein